MLCLSVVQAAGECLSDIFDSILTGAMDQSQQFQRIETMICKALEMISRTVDQVGIPTRHPLCLDITMNHNKDQDQCEDLHTSKCSKCESDVISVSAQTLRFLLSLRGFRRQGHSHGLPKAPPPSYCSLKEHCGKICGRMSILISGQWDTEESFQEGKDLENIEVIRARSWRIVEALHKQVCIPDIFESI